MSVDRIYIISIIIFIFSIFVISVYSNANDAEMQIVCKKYSHTGDEFDVKINITTSIPSKGAQCDILFNPDVIHVLNVSNGGMFDIWMNDLSPNFTKWDNVNGTITNIVAFSFSSTTTAGTFAVIKFQAVGEGTSYINISNAIISDKNGSKINATIKNATLIVDDTPPETAVNIEGNENNNVFTEDVSIKFTAKDSISGISYTEYRIDNGNWKKYTGSFIFGEDGEHTIFFYSVDNAGNKEDTKTKTFVIEKNAPPIASFHYSPSSPNEGEEIHFYSNSSDDGIIVNYTWQFGDGNIGYGKNVSHVYSKAGNYDVTLTVKDDYGLTNSTSKTINVGALPSTHYTLITSVVPYGSGYISPSDGTYDEGVVITLTAYANNGYTFDHWGEDASGTNPTIQIIMDKNKTIVAYFVAIQTSVNFSIHYSPEKIHAGENVNFEALGNSELNYTWQFGDGSIGYGKNVSHVYSKAGNYEITCTGKNGEKTVKKNIVINVLPSNLSMFIAPSNPAPGVAVNFSAKCDFNASYTWQFGDGSIGYGKNVSHVYSKAGNYNITLVATDGGFNKKVTKVMEISLPDFYASLLDKYVNGNKANYTIVIGNQGGFVPSVKVSFYDDGNIIYTRNVKFSGEDIEIIRGEFDKNKKIKVVVNPEGSIEENDIGNNLLYLYYTTSAQPSTWLYLIPLIAAIAGAAFYFYRLNKKKIKIRNEKKELRCEICFGKFKPGSEIVRCECGAIFHKSCAKRVGACPICGRELNV